MRKYYLSFFILNSIYLLIYILFNPLLLNNSLPFPYAIHPFDIAKNYPDIFYFIKRYFVFSNLFICLSLNLKLFLTYVLNRKDDSPFKKRLLDSKQKHLNDAKSLNIFLGFNEAKESIFLPEKSLYQNILITGAIGTGKTSSAVYPITRQILSYNSSVKEQKIGGLILDVKGNFHKELKNILFDCGRLDDLITIDLSGNIRYNPLDKPHLNTEVLASRLKEILLLFSPETSESFWMDKAEHLISECIKFIRIYNNGYVSFSELSKIINSKSYYLKNLKLAKSLFYKNLLSEAQMYELSSFIDYYDNEFLKLDNRTSNIIRAEISRITSIFISNYQVNKVFCPKKEEINFSSFDEVISKGKIVVLNMNISEYSSLSKIIAAYLKLDFQSSVLSRLSNPGKICKSFFICDEYQEYVTAGDSNFYSTAREAKCINIISTQSYTSLKNALCSESQAMVIIQSLINKIWFRTDDNYTISSLISQIGKENKVKESKTISENEKNSVYNYFTKSFSSSDSAISESYNKYMQLEDKFDAKLLSQDLKTFEALVFLSDGDKIISPQKINLVPRFLLK